MPSPPPSSDPALQVAARLLAQGRPTAAAERLAALVSEAPTYAAAHVLRATALEAAGFIDEALVSWGRAAALVPQSPLVHRERERLLALQVSDDAPEELPPAEPAPSAIEPAVMPPASGRGASVQVDAHVSPTPPTSPEASSAKFETEPESPSASSETIADEPESSPAGPDPGTEATPQAEGADPGTSSVADDLDSLIAKLEDAGRIKPDPTYSGPTVSLDAPDVDDLASETLAKIYAAQHQYARAAVIYEKLAARQPEDADDLLRRAAELRQRG